MNKALSDWYLHNDPRLPLAWAPWFSHEYINYCAVQALQSLIALPPVPVRPNPDPRDDAWPLGPRHIDMYREAYREARALDPMESFDYGCRNGEFCSDPPEYLSIEPWKVLVIYSTEPDLHPDCDLFLHKRQKLAGGSHGWRHMEFRVLGMNVGIARDSVRYYRDKARVAFNNGEDYWGWRYLSRCTHYLADLGNPFHVKALPGAYLFKHIASARTLFTTVSAIHKSYELYVERRFREGFLPFGEALERGAREGSESVKDDARAMDRYVGSAKKRLNPIFNHFLDQYGSELIDVFKSKGGDSDEDASVLVSRCAADAAGVIFRESKASTMEDLDRITARILHDVGRMLGSLLAGFVKAE